MLKQCFCILLLGGCQRDDRVDSSVMQQRVRILQSTEKRCQKSFFEIDQNALVAIGGGIGSGVDIIGVYKHQTATGHVIAFVLDEIVSLPGIQVIQLVAVVIMVVPCGLWRGHVHTLHPERGFGNQFKIAVVSEGFRRCVIEFFHDLHPFLFCYYRIPAVK